MHGERPTLATPYTVCLCVCVTHQNISIFVVGLRMKCEELRIHLANLCCGMIEMKMKMEIRWIFELSDGANCLISICVSVCVPLLTRVYVCVTELMSACESFHLWSEPEHCQRILFVLNTRCTSIVYREIDFRSMPFICRTILWGGANKIGANGLVYDDCGRTIQMFKFHARIGKRSRPIRRALHKCIVSSGVHHRRMHSIDWLGESAYDDTRRWRSVHCRTIQFVDSNHARELRRRVHQLLCGGRGEERYSARCDVHSSFARQKGVLLRSGQPSWMDDPYSYGMDSALD